MLKRTVPFSVAGGVTRDHGEHRTSTAHRDLQEKRRTGYDRISFAMLVRATVRRAGARDSRRSRTNLAARDNIDREDHRVNLNRAD